MVIAAFLFVIILAALAWFLWNRACQRWRLLSTREKERRSRASFLFSRKGKRRKTPPHPIRYLPR
ncbi:hypothetical protein [uncultured Sphingomonas sp.]|uniref:hypothetical protein n=1 Tax=uncultured Sphingomonas sp. TaxID=158754 RepID=UPI0035CBDB36